MNDLIQEHLEKKAKQRKEESARKKYELLVKLDIYEKEYKPQDFQDPNGLYCGVEVDEKTGAYRLFRKVYPQITDEEYEKLSEAFSDELERIRKIEEEKASKEQAFMNSYGEELDKDSQSNPWIVPTLRWFGAAEIGFGLIAAIIVGIEWESVELFLGVLSAALVTGTLFYALGEIVYLLERIRDKK